MKNLICILLSATCTAFCACAGNSVETIAADGTISKKKALPKKMASKEAIETIRRHTASDSLPSVPSGAEIICTNENKNRIIIMSADCDWDSPDALLWSWSAGESSLSKPIEKSFANFSDIKTVRGGKQILTVASAGGVALIDRASKKVLFAGKFPMWPHSAAILPDGNIVVASSRDCKLTVVCVPQNFDNYSETARSSFDFNDAHGCVWDAEKKVLYSIGKTEIGIFEYNFKKNAPALKKIGGVDLPDYLFGGHDLNPVPHTRLLFASGHNGVGIFNPDNKSFMKISDAQNIKSVSMHPKSGAIIVQRPSEKYYSPNVRFLNAPNSIFKTYTDNKFYKVRWVAPDSFGE